MPDPVLYILMRSDMASLNPGKAMAQAAHAANQMVYEAFSGKANSKTISAVEKWQKQANGFGTTIVLDVGGEYDLQTLMVQFDMSSNNSDFFYNITVDPEYPLVDGEFIHQIPNVPTCGYVFSPAGRCVELDHLELYR